MSDVKPIADWMAERGIDVARLVEATSFERRVIEAIAAGRYTPSPEQRKRLAAALGIDLSQITWGHASPVEHMYGHGPQFGRSP